MWRLAIFVLFAIFGCHMCQNATTTAPPTSTVAPSTTLAPNTSTTLAPKTTTTPVPTTSTTQASTTHSPTPQPPTTISGNISDVDHICIRYEFAVHFIIQYTTLLNKTVETTLELPLNSLPSHPNGTCSSAKETFTLIGTEALSGKPIELQLTFASNDNSVFLESINLTVTYENKSFPNISSSLIGKTHTYNLTGFNPNFNVEKSHSYFCANVTIPKNDANVKVVFSSLKLQAFMEKSKKGEFSSEHNCQNEINDVVPIAVGAALTGLVVIVMIAYFIGRRRSRRLAYQSV